jgi:predicted branched-subunit amino acid permease
LFANVTEQKALEKVANYSDSFMTMMEILKFWNWKIGNLIAQLFGASIRVRRNKSSIVVMQPGT